MWLFIRECADCSGDIFGLAEQSREILGKENCVVVELASEMRWDKVYRYLEDADAIVLFSRVWMDSVSSAVLSFLERIEAAVVNGESIGGRFYAVLYTELYEPEQTSIAMGILKNFCIRANIAWGRGLGIGGTGISFQTRTCLWMKWRKRREDFRRKALQEQALFIQEGMQGKDAYMRPDNLSRQKYIREINHAAKKNRRVKFDMNLTQS